MKRGDKIVYLGVAVAFLASLGLSYLLFSPGGPSENLFFEVLEDGAVVRTGELPRSPDGAFEVTVESGGGTNVLSVAPEGVAVVSSDCRGGDCLRFPRTGRPGGTIVCLPHRLVVRILGEAGSAPDELSLDAVAY